MRRRTMVGLSFGSLMLVALAASAAAQALPKGPLAIVVHENLAAEYRTLFGEGSPGTITSFRGMKRDLVELLLLAQAIEGAGFSGGITFLSANSFDRSIEMVIRGQALMAGTLWWPEDIQTYRDAFLPPIVILESGDTVWGIYGLADNLRLQAAGKSRDFRGLTALTDPSWTRDVRALKALGVQIMEIKDWTLLKRMLVNQRADFTLLPFAASADMGVTWEGARVLPVPGVKVGIPGQRSFVVGRQYPQSRQIHAALRQRFALMLADGTVRKAFREAGFVDDPRIRDWHLIRIPAL